MPGHTSSLARGHHGDGRAAVAVASVRANRASGCDDCSVPIDLTMLERSIRANELDLDAAAVRWSVTPVSPNYGKAVTSAQFDGAEWLASVIARESVKLISMRDSRRSNGQVLTITDGARPPSSGFRLLTTNERTVCRETCTGQMRRVLTRWPLPEPEPSLPKQAGRCH